MSANYCDFCGISLTPAEIIEQEELILCPDCYGNNFGESHYDDCIGKEE